MASTKMRRLSVYCRLSTQYGYGVSRAISSVAIAEPTCWSEARPFSEIPGPKSYPIIKSLPYALTGAPVKLTELFSLMSCLREEFGPIVRWEMPFIHAGVFISDPEMLDHILKHGMGKWPTRDVAPYMATYRRKRKEWHDGSVGIFPANNEEWYNMRSKVQQPMLRPKTCVHYLPAMDDVAQDFIELIKDLRDPKNKQVPDDFQNEIYKWSLESIAIVALNARLGCLKKDMDRDSDGQRMIESANRLFHIMGELEFSVPTWKVFPTKMFRDFAKEMDKVTLIGMKHVNKQMDKMKNNTGWEDLSVLEKFLVTPGMSKGTAATMALDMLLAGIHTTGNSIAYFLFHMAKNPDVQAKLQKEIDKVVPDVTTPITTEALNRMPYMKACIKESSRINPVASAFPRNIENDITVGGYRLPKGSYMIAAVMLMSRDERHYPEALKFKPERWIRGSPEQSSANPYTFLPFGHGARLCIGKRIAEQELWVLATKLLKHFRVEYHYDDIGVVTRLVNVPKEPLRFQFHDRQ